MLIINFVYIISSDALRVIQHSKELHYKKYGAYLYKLRNILVVKILAKTDPKDLIPKYQLIEYISDMCLKAEVVFANVDKIKSYQLATRLIRSILLHSKVAEISDEQRIALKAKLSNIHVYSEIANVMSTNYEDLNWITIMVRSKQSPEAILYDLIERREYELCYRWSQIHPLCGHQVANPKFIDTLTRALLSEKAKNADLFQLIESLPQEMVLTFDSAMLLKLKNRQLLEYLVDYLAKQAGAENFNYQRYKISLKILEVIPAVDADSLWGLTSKPLLIIEQYIMNSRFETLEQILKAIRPLINGQPSCKQCAERKDNIMTLKNNSDPSFNTRLYCDNSNDFSMLNNDINHESHYISIACIDALLRVYAGRALDFRISETHSTTDVMSQSTDMASLDSLCGTFVMPREVPEKSSWIRDEDAKHCMCCKRSVFTMLTRRHHCRRCGRVVCHACSTKRMQIPNMYADILVRVCGDCFRQTELMNSTEAATSPSGSPHIMPSFPEIITRTTDEDGWLFRFSGNQKHDNLLREEFCFEYAPSVSLCLNILAIHSYSSECGNFLLQYCRKFEALLQPIQPGCANMEVDYSLVTRILYCLSLAAKV